MTIRNLNFMFKPRSIAIFSQGTDDMGPAEVLQLNLVKSGFRGPVMPVNPDRRAVAGVLTYKDVASLPEVPDLAILTTPMYDSPAVISALGARGTRAVMLVNNEVINCRAAGIDLRQAILDAAKPYVLRVLGPDRLGMAIPLLNVNATLSHSRLLPGHIGLLTQSSAIMRALINWAERRTIGFSHLVSLGARLDVDFSDLLDYLAQDSQTHAILLYLERIRKSRKFMSAARVAARVKPVIVLKPRSYDDERVEDAIYDAAFRRAGLLRVDTIERLFNSVETVVSAKPVHKNRLLILGNSRSTSLLASSMLRRHKGVLAAVSAATQAELAKLCPPFLRTDNPIDLGDNAGPEEYGRAVELLLKEPQADGVLVVHVPGAAPEMDEKIAHAIVERAAKSRRMVMTSWVGATSTAPARLLFRKAGIPTYSTPDEAARSFVRTAQYRRNQELLMETPPSIPEEFTPDTEKARQIIATALAAGRDQLAADEASRVLAAYEIPMVTTRIANDPREAADLAQELGCAVALKIVSPDIVDRADVGGVALALEGPEEVFIAASAMLKRVHHLAPTAKIDGFALQPMLSRHGAYEVTIGVRTGRQFGSTPVLLFGQGGTETHVINDIAYALPPLNMQLAHELMSRTRIYTMLSTSAGRPADLDAIALTLIKVSQMVVDLGELVEMDINPLWVNANGVLALNAVVNIAETHSARTERLAIHPYPKELEQIFPLPDGRTLYLRPILPEDEPALQDMVRRMPIEDRRLRFFQPIKELTHDVAARLTQLDYDREMALVVTGPGTAGKAMIWGVVRMMADPDLDQAEYAIAVDRTMTGLGLGPMLMRRIIDYARKRGVRELYGHVLSENEPMLKLNRAFGFAIEHVPDDPGLVRVSLPLHSA